MQIAQSKTREQFPLSYKKIIKKTISQTIAVTILLMIIWVFWSYLIHSIGEKVAISWIENMAFGIVGFLFLLIMLTYFYQRWYFATYFYDLANDYIVIRKGTLTPSEITIPYERLQDVYVDQDLLDRIFGLYDVHVSSATSSSGTAAHIDGVEKTAADGLREILLQTIKQRISKHGGGNVAPNNLTT